MIQNSSSAALLQKNAPLLPVISKALEKSIWKIFSYTVHKEIKM